MSNKRFRHHTATLVALPAAIAVVAQLPSAALANTPLSKAPVNFECLSDAQLDRPQSYLIAIHGGSQSSIRMLPNSKGNQLNANVVVYVKVGNAIRPLVQRSQSGKRLGYVIDCKANLLTNRAPTTYPTVVLGLDNRSQTSALLEHLRQATERLASEPTLVPLLFSGTSIDTALVPLPARGQITYGDLVSRYLDTNNEAAFLATFPGAVTIEVDNADGTTFKIDKRRSRVARGDQDRQSSGRASIARPLATRHRRNLKIGFAYTGWSAADLSQPGLIDTFGYCAGIAPDPQTKSGYILDKCVADSNGQTPLQISGFEPLMLTKTSTKLDALLQLKGYRINYPADWLMGAADRAEITGGRLSGVLKSGIELLQFGLPGCRTAVRPAITDLLKRTLAFPSPPCTVVELGLPKAAMTKVRPAITDGCAPGSRTPVIADASGNVLCVRIASNTQPDSPQGTRIPTSKDPRARALASQQSAQQGVTLEWAPGFAPLALPLDNQNVPRLELPASVVTFLRPLWPLKGLAGGTAGAPGYAPRTVQYFVAGKPCGAPLPLNASNTLPTLAENGCTALPDTMRITFAIDHRRTDPGITLDAYRQRIELVYGLGAGWRGPTAFDLTNARVNFHIGFTDEQLARYEKELSEPFELLVKGTRIFSDNRCANRYPNGAVEVFAPRSKGNSYQWPLYAQVLDNDGRGLTLCAPAKIVTGAAGKKALTFDFTSVRATGPRRSIIVARSQELLDKRGMASALTKALGQLVTTAGKLHGDGARLSPVDVLSVSGDGQLRRVFSGEGAAFEPNFAMSAINKMDRSAPRTIDLSLLRLHPETKSANRILIIMDGSISNRRDVSELRLLASDLATANGGGGFHFMLSSESCDLWKPHSRELTCTNVGALPQSRRVAVLIKAFTDFLNPIAPQQPAAQRAGQRNQDTSQEKIAPGGKGRNSRTRDNRK